MKTVCPACDGDGRWLVGFAMSMPMYGQCDRCMGRGTIDDTEEDEA